MSSISLEEIVKVEGESAISEGTSAAAAATTVVEGAVAHLVTLTSLVFVRQDLISGRNLFELLLSPGVLVSVWVVLHGQFPERLLDIPVRGTRRDTQDLVLFASRGPGRKGQRREEQKL